MIRREWAMPNKWTFSIKPISELLHKYVGDGAGWVDPFAGKLSPAEITNDINPQTEAKYHLHAIDFMNMLRGQVYNGVIFDPPYSLRQLKECYESIDMSMSFDESKRFPGNVKDVINPLVKMGGYVISCGWNSGGIGKKRGFEMIEVLLVPHGGHHNDTIVTVEQKIANT